MGAVTVTEVHLEFLKGVRDDAQDAFRRAEEAYRDALLMSMEFHVDDVVQTKTPKGWVEAKITRIDGSAYFFFYGVLRKKDGNWGKQERYLTQIQSLDWTPPSTEDVL